MTSKKTAKENGRIGGRRAVRQMTAAEWSAHCSHAARVRWWLKRGRRDANGKFCARPV